MKIEKKAKWRLGLLPALIAAFTSCGDVFNSDEYKIDKVKASPSLTLPLIYGDLVVEDLLSKIDNTHIKVDQDGVVSLIYNQTLRTQGIQDLLTFPDKNFNITVPIASGPLNAKSNESSGAPIIQTVDFAFNPEKLSELKFKTTMLSVSVAFTPSSPASTVYDVQVKLPSFKLNNVPFQGRITPGGIGSAFAMHDYVATLTDNTFPVEITLIEKPHAAVTISNPTIANISIDFLTVDFKYVKGFFGDQSITNIPEETIEFTTFGEAWTKASVSFANPKLSFSVSNDYGIPTKVSFNPIEAQKNSGAALPIVLNPSSPISVNVPAQLGESATTEVEIINAKQLIDFVPDKFRYKISSRINEGLTGGSNFCADTSKISVNFKAEIPLYGKASGIVMADTFNIDLSDTENSQIESGAIKAKIRNELPMDGLVQLYLADDNATVFDSLFTTAQTAIVRASTVNPSGELLTAGLYDQEITIAKEKLNKLLEAKKIIAKAKVSTSKDATGNQMDVKFKASYKMNVAFGLKIKLKLEVDL